MGIASLHPSYDLLAETPAQRRHHAGKLKGARPAQTDPAAARRAVEERTGRASARTDGIFEPARSVSGFNFQITVVNSLRHCRARPGNPSSSHKACCEEKMDARIKS